MRIVSASIKTELTFWPIKELKWDADAIERLSSWMQWVCSKFKSRLLYLEVEGPEITLGIEYGPTVSLSRLVNSLKGVSSRYLRESRQDMREASVGDSFWAASYRVRSIEGEL